MTTLLEAQKALAKELMTGEPIDTIEGRLEVDEISQISDGFGGWLLEVCASSEEPSEALGAEFRNIVPNPFVHLGFSVGTIVSVFSEPVELFQLDR